MTAEAEPGAAVAVCYGRGILERARGGDLEALTAFEAAERLNAPDLVVPRARALQMFALVRLGDTERAGQILADLNEPDRERCDVRVETAGLRLARDDPGAAVAALAPVLDGSAPMIDMTWPIRAFLLEAIARDALGDGGRALERALDLAESDGWLLHFLLCPAPDLLERDKAGAVPPTAR